MPPAALTPADLLALAPLQTRRAGLVALTGVRVVQAGSWPLAVLTAGTAGLREAAWAWLAWLLAVLLAGVSVAGLWRFQPLTRWADVATVALLGLGGLLTVPGFGTGFSHPTFAVAVGAALSVVLVWSPRRSASVLLAFAAAYLLGVRGTLEQGQQVWSSAATELLTLVALPMLVALLARRWLADAAAGQDAHRAGQQAQDELDRVAGRLAALERREQERARQYRVLHDTVLSSLSALSRGGLDLAEPRVRQRVGADADYLRGLIAASGSTAGMRLVGELDSLARDQAAFGLRVHRHVDDVPDELPDDVVSAVCGAVGEALHNVIKHSGTTQAWVTLVGEGQGVVVTVTDRGCGFDPQAKAPGLGLSRSVRARMEEVGGTVQLDSAPDQGTSVELRWPR